MSPRVNLMVVSAGENCNLSLPDCAWEAREKQTMTSGRIPSQPGFFHFEFRFTTSQEKVMRRQLSVKIEGLNGNAKLSQMTGKNNDYSLQKQP